MRSLLLVLLVSAAALAGCTQTLSEADCSRYRDRLKGWGEKKGKLDQKSLDDFMKTCAGSTVSRSTARCLEAASDETAFFKCLE
jgi:hypothetical protein